MASSRYRKAASVAEHSGPRMEQTEKEVRKGDRDHVKQTVSCDMEFGT